MNCRNLRTRLVRLESKLAPRRVPRIVFRIVGPGSERFPQPTKEEMDEFPVITVRFTSACEGRAKTQCRRAAAGLEECPDRCLGLAMSRPSGN